ncbi:MAG: universal stress protein [Thermodesulfovibrionales bacterium]|jgi:nucleotide-binding universal stress UspA family protein
MKKILIAHDGSKSSEKALKKAFQIAETFGSSLTVLSVIPELYLTELMEMDRVRILDTMAKETREMMEKIKAKSKHVKSLKTVIKQGDPADEILNTAERMKADVIITGSHGRHGAQRFLLGSVSSKIVDHAECDVLVVKK